MRVEIPTRARDPRPGLWPSEGREVADERPMMRGGLLLYHYPTAFWYRNAAMIMDHVDAFERYSGFEIQKLNTDLSFPRRVAELDFELVIVHFTIAGGDFYHLTEDQLEWLKSSRGHKVLLVQDEYQFCGHRFWFCDETGVDTIHTMLERSEHDKVYGSRTKVPRIRTSLPGYVSEELIAEAARFQVPDERRPVDIGYRGRPSQPHSGPGGREKYEIGLRFSELASDSGLVLDIAVEEADRLYGKAWARFLSSCKGVLGVESGTSVFDLDDRVLDQWESLTADGVEVTAEDLTEAADYEDHVFYRTISARHFESAATRTCQILFEGRYSGLLEPMVHYIPLKKDFSNLNEVLRLFRDPEVRRELTENAHRDLIASGRYSYERFIEDFDRDLMEGGLTANVRDSDVALANRAVNRGRRRRGLRAQVRWIARAPGLGYLLGNLFRFTGAVRRLLSSTRSGRREAGEPRPPSDGRSAAS